MTQSHTDLEHALKPHSAGIPVIVRRHEQDFTAPGISTLKGVRILLVEDSWHVAHALASILDNIGMIVAGPAATLADAEKILHTQRPDVAVVDMNLHGEMAYGLVAHLHQLDIPVIVVSGYEVLPCVQETVAAVLTKPIRAEQLLTELRRVVSQHDIHSQPDPVI